MYTEYIATQELRGNTDAAIATLNVAVVVYLYWVDNEMSLLTSLMQCLFQVRLGHIFKGYTHKDVSH